MKNTRRKLKNVKGKKYTKRQDKRQDKKKTKTKRIFKKKDYLSGDGMLTTIWGPNMWHYLHTLSFNYPINPTNDNKKYYKEFILNLQHTLPCKHCRTNLKNNFKAHPLLECHLKNRDTFSRYIYTLHEIVNKMLNKKSGLSYCDVRERYEHFRSRCTYNISVLKKENKLFKFRKTKKQEKGCTEPLYGKKAKCVLNIVPQEKKINTINIHHKCMKRH
jgi:hypothetical protein